MNVRELIEKLQQMDLDMQVRIQVDGSHTVDIQSVESEYDRSPYDSDFDTSFVCLSNN